MKRNQIIQYKKQLEAFLHRLRFVIWTSVALSVGMFFIAILLLLKKMLLSSVLIATLAFITFRVLREYSVIITKIWVRSRGGQEEMLLFLDKEMKDTSSRDFFHLLEHALQVIEGNK